MAYQSSRDGRVVSLEGSIDSFVKACSEFEHTGMVELTRMSLPLARIHTWFLVPIVHKLVICRAEGPD